MESLNSEELKLFVESVRQYFRVLTKQEPQITSAFLATGDLQGHEYNGIVTFSGSYNGHVIVSMPGQLLKELLLLQGRTTCRRATCWTPWARSPTRWAATPARPSGRR
ncbi:hypothetical protein [Ramlibacter montanisoli]|uniref:hypothetical protein n=1 Tax=Ramlibacter montanisoli TaxID=2732512 RepID=UPI00209C1B7B|nr:hypothetical protein [Ramlibacter montanisoli]